jgi:hypothetical protein
MANRSSIYKDNGNEVCLILGAPIQDIITLQVNERVVMQQDSFTMDSFPISLIYREYYLGDELLGKVTEDTPSPWSFRGDPPYKRALTERGLTIVNKSEGEVVGMPFEGLAWASGVQVNVYAIDKAKKKLREALPYYKGIFNLYLFCFSSQDA